MSQANKPQEKADRPTQRAVAERAGVHQSTVSLALNQHASIPEETRERVERAAAELGYRPNPLVTALMRTRRRGTSSDEGTVLAYLVHHPDEAAWRSSQRYAALHQGAEERAARHGFRLEIFRMRDPKVPKKRQVQILGARGIRGLLLAPLPGSLGHARLPWEQFCPVALGYSMVSPELHRVAPRYFQTMIDLMRELRRRGYRRPGLAVPSHILQKSGRQWVGAYLLETQRLPLCDRLPVHGGASADRAAFLEWVGKNRPDVVLTALGSAHDFSRHLAHANLACPDDIGMAVLDITGERFPFSGIQFDTKEEGATAVDLVVQALHHNETGVPVNPRLILINGLWREGGTLRGK